MQNLFTPSIVLVLLEAWPRRRPPPPVLQRVRGEGNMVLRTPLDRTRVFPVQDRSDLERRLVNHDIILREVIVAHHKFRCRRLAKPWYLIFSKNRAEAVRENDVACHAAHLGRREPTHLLDVHLQLFNHHRLLFFW